jgi:hypothetical protein
LGVEKMHGAKLRRNPDRLAWLGVDTLAEYA